MIKKYANLLVLLGSLWALGLALYAQYIGGYHPCELCIWQRWVYLWVIIAALFTVILEPAKTLTFQQSFASVLVTILLGVQVAIAIYHTGIEQKWWEGFQSCSSSFSGGQSLEDLRNKIMAAPTVRCDEATWFFLGLSMAAWNAIYAFFLFMVSLLPLWRAKSI